jgi:hypothetical protein
LILSSKLLCLPRSIQVIFFVFNFIEAAASIAGKFKGGVNVISSSAPGGMAGNLSM